MTAGEAPTEKSYQCPGCGRLLLITAARNDRVRGVWCRDCRRAVTIFLDGWGERPGPQGGGVVTVGDGDPRNPPIETRTVTGRPAGQGRR